MIWFIGPLLFILYINDLPECVNCESQLYADDSKLMSAYSNPLDRKVFQRSIDAVTDLTKDWLMRLNLGKCKVMNLWKKNVNIDFEIEDLISRDIRYLDKTLAKKIRESLFKMRISRQ